ncbi:MAG: hypothetical protein EOP42_14155 [Sphingobacteriaceae bacterium]|nr:MAG: hypothetical protein EOP42_14155 [Sphingobacteriaceae bacterium]
MQPIFFTVGARLPLMVIPQSQADLYDYPVMTFTYHIYWDNRGNDKIHLAATEENFVQINNIRKADFLGYIVFEFPEKDFNYIEQGPTVLNAQELNEAIRQIALYRKSYGVWEV